ncbi:MAG: NAD(P)-dependent oxidoreductase [Candidatus Competibacter denitrificans]
MNIVIFGSEGKVGLKLQKAFQDQGDTVTGIDRTGKPDIKSDIKSLDFSHPDIERKLNGADVVIHLATSPREDGPDDEHYQAIIDTSRLLAACARVPVPRVLLPSSDWADPRPGWKPINTYGYSKRVFEQMAEMYRHSTKKRCVALRIGWVPDDPNKVQNAEPWLRDNYWPDERLIRVVKAALEL